MTHESVLMTLGFPAQEMGLHKPFPIDVEPRALEKLVDEWIGAEEERLP